jgi:prepilin-type N-terminal cleavage/methylation domain-containing protein
MRHNRGFTLMELVVASGMTGIVLLATSQVMMASQDAMRVAVIEADLAAQNALCWTASPTI